MDKKIRLRLIGVGTMGSVYVQYLLQGDCPDFILAAVSDINIARKAEIVVVQRELNTISK